MCSETGIVVTATSVLLESLFGLPARDASLDLSGLLGIGSVGGTIGMSSASNCSIMAATAFSSEAVRSKSSADMMWDGISDGFSLTGTLLSLSQSVIVVATDGGAAGRIMRSSMINIFGASSAEEILDFYY